MDEIDIEEARLDFLKAQKQQRLTDIIEDNKYFEAKPKHVQKCSKYIFGGK